MQTLGEFLVSDTIDFKFNSHSAAGAPITLAGTPEVSLYADNGTTEITSGVTLTVDHDSRTGMHHVRVDPSSLSPGQYTAVLTAGTVDGTSVVGVQIARFTLGVKNYLRPTTAGRTLDVTSTGEAGIDFGNVLIPTSGPVQALGYSESGTAQSGSTSSTLNLRSGSGTVREGSMVILTAGTGVGQSRYAAADSSTTLSVEPDWDVTPDNTSVYAVIPTAPKVGGGGDCPTADEIADEVETRTLYAVGSVIGSVGSVAGNVSGSVASVAGNVTGSVGSVTGNVGGTVNGLTATAQGNVRTAVGLASANLDTQIGTLATSSGLTSATSPLATSSALSSVAGDATAIKAKTDQMTFTVTNRLDVNIRNVNGVGVTGAGVSGNYWRPA